jgi:hypothetical protein
MDLTGQVIAGKSTLVLRSINLADMKFICGVLNSILAISYIKEKYSSASYNGGIVFTKDMINNFPINLSNQFLRQTIVAAVDSILSKRMMAKTSNIEDEQKIIDMCVFHLYDFEYGELSDLANRLTFTEAEYNGLRVH